MMETSGLTADSRVSIFTQLVKWRRKCEKRCGDQPGHTFRWGNGSHQQCWKSRVFFFVNYFWATLYFLLDKLTQQRLANPAAFINFLWQTLIPQQLGPTLSQGQTSSCLAARLQSKYTGTLSQSHNGKAWQGLYGQTVSTFCTTCSDS